MLFILLQTLLSMLYLCSSDIFALINYVGFATWVRSLNSLKINIPFDQIDIEKR